MDLRTRARLRSVVAWLVTLSFLGFLAWRVPLREVWRHLAQAQPWALGLGLIGLGAIYGLDSLATWSTFRRLTGPLPLGGLMVARGASYLLTSINYVAGQGALLYFVSRANSQSAARGAATVMVIAVGNFAVLLLLGGVGLSLTPDAPALMPVLLAAGIAGTLGYGLVIVIKPAWLRRYAVLEGVMEAGLGGHAWAALVRIPHVLAVMAYSLMMFRAFGIEVPLANAMFGLPLVYVIAFLPISVQGLGTSQAAMIPLFAHFAPGDRAAQEAAVVACSLSAVTLVTVFQLVVGLICLRTPLGQALKARPAAP